jgi:hypothetical protein
MRHFRSKQQVSSTALCLPTKLEMKLCSHHLMFSYMESKGVLVSQHVAGHYIISNWFK